MYRFRPLLWLLLLVSPISQAAAPPRVTLPGGVLEGVRESGLLMFKGIPFAAPPTGPLRWREPQPVPSWKGVRKADAFAARCMQLPVFSDMKFRSNGVSEEIMTALAKVPTGTAVRCQGFLARRYRTGITIALHVNAFETLDHASEGN